MGYYTRNVLLTGYWPPTNEMLRPFSPNRAANPDRWLGADWEGRGYDVYAFFPEFAGPDTAVGLDAIGVGEMVVDYRATARNWARLTAELDPCAIITFSRGRPGRNWELEWRQRNLDQWVDGFSPAAQPDPAPPDPSVPAGHIRCSTLPVRDIERRVNDDATLELAAYVNDSDDFGGGFVSEYTAYLATWYQARHAAGFEPRCFAAGHVHVGTDVPLGDARRAVTHTLGAVLDHVDGLLPTTWVDRLGLRLGLAPGSPAIGGPDLQVEVERDGELLFTVPVPAASGFHIVEVLDRHGVGGAGPPTGPTPPRGIELPRGVVGHLQCRLGGGRGDWIAGADAELYIRPLGLTSSSFDAIEWEPGPIWFRIGPARHPARHPVEKNREDSWLALC